MKPITVYGARSGQPFTVSHNGTVRSLRDALTHLCDLGYGGTDILRADAECGPCPAWHLELYDTTDEQKRGALDCDTLFLIR